MNGQNQSGQTPLDELNEFFTKKLLAPNKNDFSDREESAEDESERFDIISHLFAKDEDDRRKLKISISRSVTLLVMVALVSSNYIMYKISVGCLASGSESVMIAMIDLFKYYIISVVAEIISIYALTAAKVFDNSLLKSQLKDKNK